MLQCSQRMEQMIKKTQIQLISLDQLVPEDHLLKENHNIDFDFIYDLVEEKYSAQTGRPVSIRSLIKIPIIQYM